MERRGVGKGGRMGNGPLNQPDLQDHSEKVSFHLDGSPTTGHRSLDPPPHCHRVSRQTRSEGCHTQQHDHTALTDYWFHSRTNVAVFLLTTISILIVKYPTFELRIGIIQHSVIFAHLYRNQSVVFFPVQHMHVVGQQIYHIYASVMTKGTAN